MDLILALKNLRFNVICDFTTCVGGGNYEK